MNNLKRIGSTLGNPQLDEMQRLSKSILACQVKDILDQPGASESEKMTEVRGLLEYAIKNVPQSPVEKAFQGLAKSVLARQIRGELDEEDGSSEEKIGRVRSLVEYYIEGAK